MLQYLVEMNVAMTEQVHAQLQAHAIVTLVVGKLDESYDFLEWLRDSILFFCTAAANLV